MINVAGQILGRIGNKVNHENCEMAGDFWMEEGPKKTRASCEGRADWDNFVGLT